MQNILDFMIDNVLLFLLGLLGIIFLVGLSILVHKMNRKDIKDDITIIGNLTTPRIFALDFIEGQVTYFDRGLYRDRKVGPIAQFYQQFTAKEVEELEQWVNKLLEPKSGAELSYKVDVFVKNLRRSYASILEVNKIDYVRKIIHLESYLYRYLKPNNQLNLTIKKKETIGYLHGSALTRLYKKYAHRGKGVYGAINITSLIPRTINAPAVVPHLWYELQNQTAFYRSKNRIIRFSDNYTVGIYMPRSRDVAEIVKVIQKIVRRTSAYLEKNGHDDYSLAYGLARAKHFKDMKMCIKTAEELSVHAHRELRKGLIHNPNQEVKDLDLSLYRDELASIVIKKSVETYFQPIVDARNVEILGYLTVYAPTGSLFTKFSDLETFARENNQNETLMKMVLRKTAASYYNMRRNHRQLVFIPINVDTIAFLSETFSLQPFAADLKLVFMLEEHDIGNNFDSVEEMAKEIKKIKKLGYQVTLIISDTELTLPDKIYGEVDFFMVNDTILSYTVGKERERLYLLATLGKLLRHKRPIIITDLPNWSEIEYYIRAGVDYIASDEISKKEVSLQTIDKKKALKIINFSKRK